MTGQAGGGAPGGGSGGGAPGQGGGGQGAPAAGGSILSGGTPPAGGAPGNGDQGAPAGGQGGGAPAGGGAPGGGQGTPQEWLWSEGVKGTGDRPAWFKGDKFQTVDKQAAAYVELEAKLGPAAQLIGAPEKDYAVPPLPQGMEGEVNADDPLLKGFSKVAKDMGLSQKAYDQVVNHMRGVIVGMQQEEQTRLSESIAQLGANVPARVDAVKTYITSTLGQDAFNALDQAVGTNAAAFKAVEALVAKLAGDARLATDGGTSGVGFSKQDVETERYKVFPDGHKLKGKVMYDHDPAHRAKVDGMWKKLYPGEDRQAVG